MPKEAFDPRLFAGRQVDLNAIDAWANDPAAERRLRSVVAAPGLGKSWLLAAACQRLAEAQHVVLWLEFSHDLQKPAARSLPALIDWTAWLQNQIARARKLCPTLEVYDRSAHWEAVLDRFARDLCELCGLAQTPILAVDGFDDVEQQTLRWELEERVLSRFLSSGCMRVLLARRDEASLQTALRWEEAIVPLPPLIPPEDQQQLELRIRSRHAGFGPQVAALRSRLRHYRWNHPHINAILLDRAARNDRLRQPTLLEAADLRRCLEEIVQPATLSANDFACLDQLAHIADSRNPGLLDDLLPEDLRRNGVKTTDRSFNRLFGLGIMFQVNQRYYRLADGIRELVRDLRALAPAPAASPATPAP